VLEKRKRKSARLSLLFSNDATLAIILTLFSQLCRFYVIFFSSAERTSKDAHWFIYFITSPFLCFTADYLPLFFLFSYFLLFKQKQQLLSLLLSSLFTFELTNRIDFFSYLMLPVFFTSRFLFSCLLQTRKKTRLIEQHYALGDE
jgi:hypothetical protein